MILNTNTKYAWMSILGPLLDSKRFNVVELFRIKQQDDGCLVFRAIVTYNFDDYQEKNIIFDPIAHTCRVEQ